MTFVVDPTDLTKKTNYYLISTDTHGQTSQETTKFIPYQISKFI
jgi:hypothetical protein